MRRGQSTVETMFAISAPFVVVALAGWLFPAQLDALVARIGDWVGTMVEVP
jgi:hypothetical protein